MARFTIEVDTVYSLKILAPLADMLCQSPDYDELNTFYLKDSLGCLFSELPTEIVFDEIKDYPEEWKLVANLAEILASRIRENLENNG